MEEQLEKALEDIREHELRIVKLENKSGACDGMHKTNRRDIDDILAKLNKMDNNNKVKDLLTGGAPMADTAVDTILQAIDDIQNKINSDFDAKLNNYVEKPIFEDSEIEAKVIARRVAYNESVLKDHGTTTEQNAEKIENNRKKTGRL